MALRRLRGIKEAITRVFLGSALVGTVGSLWAAEEEPVIDRKKYVEMYVKNPLARQSIDMETADAVGGGYFTDIKTDKYAKQLVDTFAAKVNLDDIIFLTTRDMLVTGDGIGERIYDKEKKMERTVVYNNKKYTKEVVAPIKGAKLVNLKWLPSWMFKVKQTPVGEVCWWTQEVEGKKVFFHPDKILDFKWNRTGLSAYGTSELKSVYSLLEDLDKIRENFVAITKRYAKPPIIWKGKGISKAQMEEHKKEVESKEADEDLYLNTDLIEAEVLEIDPRGKFENYYEQLMSAATIGLETPTLPILSKATLASSKAILEFYEKKIARIRRVVKRCVEHEIFVILVNQDSRAKEVPRLRWNVLSRRFEKTGPQFVLELFDRNLYSPFQAKQALKKWGIPFPTEEEGEEDEL